MSIETNKRLATEFFGKLSKNDLPGVSAMIAEDVVWWVICFPSLVPRARANS